MTLSPEQQHVVATATSSTTNLLISAVAGGAKTTTLLEVAKALGPGRSILFLAFNKDIAEELKRRVPYHATATTFHSFCYDTLGRHLGRKPRPDANRTKWMLKELVPEWKARREVEEDVLRLVSRAKSCGYDPRNVEDDHELYDLAERFNIEVGPRLVSLAGAILDECLDPHPTSIDFDDMLWLTLLWSIPFPHTSVILLDEAQDTNGVQRDLLKRMLGERGRLIAVGDPHQSIYGFRGADSDAMTALRDDFAMTELELSVSWRCARSVVNRAKTYAEHIECREDAPEGSVVTWETYVPSDFPSTSAVLCRNTAPLVSFAFDLLRRSVACHIVGKDIQVGLERLLEKVGGSNNKNETQIALRSHRFKEVERLRRKGKAEAAENYQDKCSVLAMFIDRTVGGLTEVKATIAKLFANGDGVTLSTIHRAKGLEWETVFLLDWHLLPSKYAETVNERRQERNLQYVAVTRAKLNLRFIRSGNWRTGSEAQSALCRENARAAGMELA